jgi:hypothetical protein
MPSDTSLNYVTIYKVLVIHNASSNLCIHGGYLCAPHQWTAVVLLRNMVSYIILGFWDFLCNSERIILI